jgi:hypothetical protein
MASTNRFFVSKDISGLRQARYKDSGRIRKSGLGNNTFRKTAARNA